VIRIDFRRLFILAAITQSSVCMAQLQETPTGVKTVVTTFCDIVQHSERFSGVRVRFRSAVISDGIDHTALADPKCKPRIIPRISEEVSGHSDVQQFRDAIFLQKPRGTAFKQVSATFTGTFVWDHRVRVLQVEAVQELTVTPRDENASKAGKQMQ
jgi:hypothetical protein